MKMWDMICKMRKQKKTQKFKSRFCLSVGQELYLKIVDTEEEMVET